MNNEKDIFDPKNTPQGPWAVYESIDSMDGGGYIDSRHPNIQSLGRRVLANALKKSLDNYRSLDDLWNVFLNHIRKHEFAELISEQIDEIKNEITYSIRVDCEKELRAKVIDQVTKEVRSEVVVELRRKFREELSPVIENQVRERLADEMATGLKPDIVRRMRMELEPKIRSEIRGELLEDPVLRSQAIEEIKKRLLGL